MRDRKEAFIIIRTIFLEFGDEELRQRRLEFSYENVAARSRGKESHHKANLDAFVNGLKSFERPEIDDMVFNFWLVDYTEDHDYEFIIVEGEKKEFNPEDEDEEDTLDAIFLTKHSKSKFFINLRKGLYYKSIFDYERAVMYLSEARREYRNLLCLVVKEATENLSEFLHEHYDVEKKDFKETFIPGKDFPQKVNLPSELLCAIEESPSFHLAEVYLDQGDRMFQAGRASEAEGFFEKANKSLKESKKTFACIFYGDDTDQAPVIPSILKKLDIIEFPVLQTFRRNYYLEKNLELLREKIYPKPKTEAEWTLATEEFVAMAKQQAEKLKGLKKTIANIKETAQVEYEREYPFLKKLDSKSKELVVDSESRAKLGYWRDAIMALSNALENELTRKLLKKVPDDVRKTFKIHNLLKMGQLTAILKNTFGATLFNLNSKDATDLSRLLDIVSRIRGETSAHPIRNPSQEDYETVKEILLNGKEGREVPLFQKVLYLAGQL